MYSERQFIDYDVNNMCMKWFNDPLYDPITKKRIEKNSKRYIELRDLCREYGYYEDYDGITSDDFDVYNRRELKSIKDTFEIADKMRKRRDRNIDINRHMREFESRLRRYKSSVSPSILNDPEYIVKNFLSSVGDTDESIISLFKKLTSHERQSVMHVKESSSLVIDSFINMYLKEYKEYFTSKTVPLSHKNALLDNTRCRRLYDKDTPNIFEYLIVNIGITYTDLICQRLKNYELVMDD